MQRQIVHAVALPALEIGEERIGLGVEKDGIVADALFVEQRLQLRPDRVMAAAVFVRLARLEEHLEGVALHGDSLPATPSSVAASPRHPRVEISMGVGGREDGYSFGRPKPGELLAPLLAPLVDIPLREDRRAKLPPEELRRRQLAAMTAWVLAGARSQPAVIAFEDLHWADPTSLDLLRALAERGAQSPLLVIATTRPEFRAPWAMRSHHGVISLAPLDRAQVRRMVGEIANRHALSDEMIDGVGERTGGVPLFVEEVTRLLLERDAHGGAQSIPPATRFLAGYGADVLRIDPPDWNEPAVEPEVTLGKRCARLDLRLAADRTRFERLIAETDVFVHGYRPEALDGLGFGEDMRRAVNPGLVDVRLDAYGWSGPWWNRRGFDSLVQMSTGIAAAGMEWRSADKPVPLPVQALDHATGYLMAAAAVRGLTLRLTEEETLTARLSLARTAELLVAARGATSETNASSLSDTDASPAIEATGWGPARRVLPPVSISGATMAWDRPASRLGSAPAGWGS